MKFGKRITTFLSRKFGTSKSNSLSIACADEQPKVVGIERRTYLSSSSSISTRSIGSNNDSSRSKKSNDESTLEISTVIPHDHAITLRPEEKKFNCQTRIPACDVKYPMVLTVVNSWEKDLKIIPNWDRIGGELLLRKMFELEPECIEMFGFPSDTKFDDPALSENEKFIRKGVALIIAVDVALTFLGPDLEPLEEQLVEMGGRHVARSCKPKHWPMVGVALFHTLEVALGEKFNPEVQSCWVVLYNFLGYHMIQGLIAKGGPTWEDN